MINEIEFNMCVLTLNNKVHELKEQTKLLKQSTYEKALESGIEKICTLGFQSYMQALDSLYNHLETLEEGISIKNNFTNSEFINFINYVTSAEFKKRYMKERLC